MELVKLTPEQIVNIANFSLKDFEKINQCRGQHNKLGFCYQLAFVKVFNRFPVQRPFEISDDILAFTTAQLNIDREVIDSYAKRQPTISNHQEAIRNYLQLHKFNQSDSPKLLEFIFREACKLEKTTFLLSKIKQYLKDHRILTPAEETLKRLIINQRAKAKAFIFRKILASLPTAVLKKLDSLIETDENKLSKLNTLKTPPGLPSPASLLKLTEKINLIQAFQLLPRRWHPTGLLYPTGSTPGWASCFPCRATQRYCP